MGTQGPVEPEVEQEMQAFANTLDALLPKEYGFAVLVFRKNTHDGRMNYVSNCKRADMIVAMKELVARFEGHDPDPNTPGAPH